MKKLIVVIAAILVSGMLLTVEAQKNPQNRRPRPEQGSDAPRMNPEQMTSMRATKMAEFLALDDTVAPKFVDMYSAYLAEQRAVNSEYRQGRNEGDEAARMSDSEVDAAIRKNFEKSRKLLELREGYYEKFLTILTPRQIQKMYSSERRMGQMASHSHGPRP